MKNILFRMGKNTATFKFFDAERSGNLIFEDEQKNLLKA